MNRIQNLVLPFPYAITSHYKWLQNKFVDFLANWGSQYSSLDLTRDWPPQIFNSWTEQLSSIMESDREPPMGVDDHDNMGDGVGACPRLIIWTSAYVVYRRHAWHNAWKFGDLEWYVYIIQDGDFNIRVCELGYGNSWGWRRLWWGFVGCQPMRAPWIMVLCNKESCMQVGISVGHCWRSVMPILGP